MSRIVITALLASLVGAAGCSALGLSNFDIAACEQSDDCSAINTYHRIPPAACERFVCSRPLDRMGRPLTTGTCVRGIRDDDADGAVNVECASGDLLADCDDTNDAVRSGAIEVCDGADNDCNGVVDDGPAAPVSARRTVAPVVEGAVFSPDLDVLLAGVEGDRVIGAVPETGEVMTVPARYRMHVPPSDGDAHMCAPPRSGTLSQSSLVDGCPRYRSTARPGEDPVTVARCSLAETALTESVDGYFVAAVNRDSCGAGQIRVGFMPSVASGEIELRGPIGRSNLWLGVDLGADGCTGSGASRGALAVSLETLPAAPERALVTFVGAPADRACGAGAAPVRVLGIARQVAAAGAASVVALNGSNGGVPETIAMSSGRPGTAVAIGGDTVLVAHGEMDGSVVVSRIDPAFPTPVLPTNLDETADICVVNDSVSTSPLSAATTEWTLAGPGVVEAVDVATRAAGPGEELAVAYQVGCGAAAEIWFAMRDAAGASTTPVRLGAGTDPQIVAAEGLVTTTFVRGGRTPDATTTGGYVVAYQASDAFHVVRIAALDGQPLQDDSTVGHDVRLSPAGVGWVSPEATHIGPFVCLLERPAP